MDDILTVSKLASNLLQITPDVAQPVEVAERALRMFEPELQAKNITIAFEKHISMLQYGVSWMAIDPSRVLQILINLIANAIKFTACTEKRAITLSIGASLEPPLVAHTAGFQYVPAKTATDANVISGED